MLLTNNTMSDYIDLDNGQQNINNNSENIDWSTDLASDLPTDMGLSTGAIIALQWTLALLLYMVVMYSIIRYYSNKTPAPNEVAGRRSAPPSSIPSPPVIII